MRLVRAFASTVDPDMRVGAIDLLGEDERHRVLVEWNAPDPDAVAEDMTVPELFARQVERVPDAVAVVCGDRSLTYAELDRESNRLARVLISRGVGPETVVAVALPRSADLIVALLGVLKAGGAYLPIDPGYPADRVAFMLADAAPILGVSLDEDCGVLEHPGLPVLTIGTPQTIRLLTGYDDAPVVDADRIRPLHPLNTAYVIYTSGSTGVPKGVIATHVGAGNLAGNQIRCLGVGVGSRVLQFASVGFDAAFWELTMALGSGAALILQEQRVLTGEGLAALVAEFGITHATLTPTVLGTVPRGELLSVTHLVVAAEACSVELVAAWATDRTMVNAYGPTELTVCATMSGPLSEASVGAGVPIGGPLSGVRVYVLGAALDPVPVGVAGELYVSGAGVARGIWGVRG
ncbi:AMP-binding protein [Rhodococcus sp. MTM3W5.2]|uniref:AMP-binding protein n=1 Tax=Rhodococcus sp. MTM3W5.2 TaxID=1805827 RepID=UPI003983AA1A